MKGYGEYKTVDVQWLGTIPSHWKSPQLREVLKERKEKVSDKDFPPLSVCKAGIVPQLSTAAKSNAGDNRKGVRTGDFVINSRSDRRGSSGISKYEGSVSLISHVLCPRGDVVGSFLHYLLRSHSFIEEFYRNGRGIVADLWTTRFDEMKTITLPIPPREEQDQIVRYLDAKVGKINKLIGIKQQQIALLKKKKQAIINQAVTKGLDPNAPMKDSGIAWIGQIPEGWAVHKMSRIAKIKSNLVDPKDYPDCIQVAPDRIEKNTGRLFPCDTVKNVGIISPNHYFEKGQILYSKIRPLLNKATIAPFDGLCSADMYPLETKIDTRYFLFYLLSFSYTSQLGISGNRVKMPKINKEEFYAKLAIVPPKKEQQAIVSFIEEKTKGLDKVEASLGEATRILTEYRTRLISDVVTGKVDVRNIPITDADTLPEMEADVTLEDDWDDSEITAEECQ